jgi:hypothetical protein
MITQPPIEEMYQDFTKKKKKKKKCKNFVGSMNDWNGKGEMISTQKKKVVY